MRFAFCVAAAYCLCGLTFGKPIAKDISGDAIVSESGTLGDSFIYSREDAVNAEMAPVKDVSMQDLEMLELQIEAAIEGRAAPMGGGAGSGMGGDCGTCIHQFDTAGGCDAWKAGEDPTHLIPAGCHHCEHVAEVHCGIPTNHTGSDNHTTAKGGLHHAVENIIEHIEQQVSVSGLSVDSYTGALKEVYELAFAMGIGAYDAQSHSVATGTTITSFARSSNGRSIAASTELLQDAAVPESDFAEDAPAAGATVSFSADSHDPSIAQAAKQPATASGFANDFNTANDALGNHVSPLAANVLTVSQPTVSSSPQDSGASASSPTLIASCLVLLATAHTLMKSA